MTKPKRAASPSPGSTPTAPVTPLNGEKTTLVETV